MRIITTAIGERIVSIEAARRLVGCSHQIMRRMVESGEIEPFMAGRRCMVAVDSLVRWARDNNRTDIVAWADDPRKVGAYQSANARSNASRTHWACLGWTADGTPVVGARTAASMLGMTYEKFQRVRPLRTWGTFGHGMHAKYLLSDVADAIRNRPGLADFVRRLDQWKMPCKTILKEESQCQ